MDRDPSSPSGSRAREATDPARFERAVEEGRQAVRQGQVVSHARVRAWLQELAAGRDTPMPEPEDPSPTR